ncbi:MAG: HAD-IIB family hydrolase, partial [Pseudomonadota bacterium]
SGGPNDIVGICEHGRLVNPLNLADLSSAALELIEDPDLWDRCAENGRRNVGFYSWERHVQTYLEDIDAILNPPKPAYLSGQRYGHLLVSDIDSTLVGDPAALTRFGNWQARADDYCFAIATGRSLHSALDVLRRARAPAPAVLVTAVGSEIYYADDANMRTLRADDDWSAWIAEGWEPRAIAEMIATHFRFERQPVVDQGRFKLSYFVPSREAATSVRQALYVARLPATAVYSHGEFLDILPPRASKGEALRYLADRFGVPADRTLAAGDSGNDLAMLEVAGRGIVVANHTDELACLRGRQNAYFAARPYAGGILEGINARATA